MEAPQPGALGRMQRAAGQLQATIDGAFGAHRPRRAVQKGLLACRATPRRVRFTPPLAAIIPGDTVVEQVFTSGLNNFLGLYNSALVARLVLTWFPNPPAFIAGPLATICDPYLNLFRGIIPPLGGTLDFSPILAFVLLSVFTNTAAALPCELGPDDACAGAAAASGAAAQRRSGTAPSAVQQRPLLDWLPLSRYQRAWAQRVAASSARGDAAQQPAGPAAGTVA